MLEHLKKILLLLYIWELGTGQSTHFWYIRPLPPTSWLKNPKLFVFRLPLNLLFHKGEEGEPNKNILGIMMHASRHHLKTFTCDKQMFLSKAFKRERLLPRMVIIDLRVCHIHCKTKRNGLSQCSNFIWEKPSTKTSHELQMLSSVKINCCCCCLPKIWKSSKTLEIFQKSDWSNVSQVTSRVAL